MQKLYVVFDSKSETYSAPTCNPARGQAIRSFGDAVNDASGRSVIHTHPEDFTLFEVGTFDPFTGSIVIYDARVSVANGLDLKISQQ